MSVQVTNNGQASAAFSVKAQASSPSFFNINGGPYVVAQHGADYSLVGPASLFPGASTPAKPGETVILYANGFGPTTPAAVSGALAQSGNPSPLPAVAIGGLAAEVQFAGLVSSGLFQINVVIPTNAPSGDNTLFRDAQWRTGSAGGAQALVATSATTRFTHSRRGSSQWDKTCKVWCRIRASIILPTRRTIIPCGMAPRAWDSSCSTPARPDGPIPCSSPPPSPRPSPSNCSIPRLITEIQNELSGQKECSR